MWRADRISPLNFVLAVRLGVTADLRCLQRGLVRLMGVRPVLGMSVGYIDDAVPGFVQAAIPPSVQCRTDATWRSLCQYQLNAAFDCPKESMLRVFCCGEAGRDVVLVFHHCLGDGTSGLVILRELLELYARELRGEVSELAEKTWGPPLEARQLSDVAMPSAPDVTGERLLEKEVALGDRQTHFLPQVFSVEETNSLVNAARRHAVSVHGLLAACQLQALALEFGRPVQLALSSPYSLRSRLEPPVGEGIGLFIGDARNSYEVDAASDPWSLARTVSADVAKGARRGGAMGEPPNDLGRVYATRASTAISNLGRFTFGDGIRPVVIEGLVFGVACSVLGDQIGAVVTASGRLSWSFCGMSPTMSLMRMQRICKGFRDRVDQCSA